jgi:probable rRNA maturation factor
MIDDWPDKVSGPRAQGAGGASSTAVEIADARRLLDSPARERLSAWVAAVTDRLASTGEVRVRLVDDAEMAAAHERYSGIPGTTDVLTFDLRDPDTLKPGSLHLDVDILACVDEARRQGTRRSHPVERELLLYIIHGILHCLGEDDHDDAAYARMHAREDDLLEAIGVGRTFAAPESEARS